MECTIPGTRKIFSADTCEPWTIGPAALPGFAQSPGTACQISLPAVFAVPVSTGLRSIQDEHALVDLRIDDFIIRGVPKRNVIVHVVGIIVKYPGENGIGLVDQLFLMTQFGIRAGQGVAGKTGGAEIHVG